MKAKTNQCLVENWQPEPAEIPSWKTMVKEGNNLPNSVTEDIGGFSLMPRYSEKILRRMNMTQKFKNKDLSRTAKNDWRLNKRW